MRTRKLPSIPNTELRASPRPSVQSALRSRASMVTCFMPLTSGLASADQLTGKFIHAMLATTLIIAP